MRDGRYGYIDATGHIVIPPQFYWATSFTEEGVAKVFVCGEYGYIDGTGKLAIPAKFDEIGQLSEGFASVTVNGKQGYVSKTGRLVIPARFDDAGRFTEGLAPVQIGDKWGYINKGGKVVIPPRFFFAREFYRGTAAVETEVTHEERRSTSRRLGTREILDGKWALIDRSGRPVASDVFTNFGFPETGFLPVFFEGLAPVSVQGGKGYAFINDEGKVVIPGPYEYALDFHNGLAPVKLGGKWGYIDRKGTLVLSPKLDGAGYFSDGVAPASLGGKWGYINKLGEWVIRPGFQFASEFRNGVANVTFAREEWGYVDRNGQVLWRAPVSEAPGHVPVTGWTEADIKKSCQ
jgi:hypothetical protein